MPLRRGCLSHRLTLCGVKITKHAPRGTQEPLADIGDGQTARGSLKDARAQPILKRGNRPRHRRRRQVQAPCRTRKAARLCHSDEHLNLVQTVHQLFLSTE